MPIGLTHHTTLLVLLAALAIACGDDGRPTDTSPGVDTGSGGDSSSGDTAPAADTGPATDTGTTTDTGAGTDGGGATCGTITCGAGELCMTVPSGGCPSGPAPDPVCVPIPLGCGDGPPACGCFAEDPCGGGCLTCGSLSGGQLECDCGCLCASPDTPIATPSGDVEIASLREGDLVYSVHDAQIVAVPVIRTNRTMVSTHRVVRLSMSNGRIIEMSPGHPTADGRTFGGLASGDLLDGFSIAQAELIPYEHPFTHDILPDSDTGAYFAAGVLVGSTLTPE